MKDAATMVSADPEAVPEVAGVRDASDPRRVTLRPRGRERGASAERRIERGSRPESLWSIRDVADYLNLSVHGVYRMTGPKARVRIPHLRIAGRLRFRQADLDRWLDLLTVSDCDLLVKVAHAAGRGR